MHKYVFHKEQLGLPSVLLTYFGGNALIHHHDTRQKNINFIHVYTVFSEYGKRTIKYKGSKIWNYLPAAMKVTKSLQSFKYKFKNFLLQTWN